MMQSVLEDRFNPENPSRDQRGPGLYALVAGKGGLKLPPAKLGCFTMGAGPRPPRKPGEKAPPACQYGVKKPDGVEVLGSTISDFCLALNVRIPLGLDRMIVDKTGIQGQYDFDLKWSPEDLALLTLRLPFPSRYRTISPSSIAPCAASGFASNLPKAPASSSSSITPIGPPRTNSCFSPLLQYS